MADRFDDAPNLAIFCDFENVAIGAREARFDDFDIHLVLERLLDKGRIVVKKAYADWNPYKPARRALHESAFELIEVPHVSYAGKNSADIRLVVDALDLCYVKEHVDIFVIVSGDSDFSPLVSKLRENNKRVIGLGVKNSTSDLLIENCDEFIYYDDLVRARRASTTTKTARPATPARPAEERPPPRSGDDRRASAPRQVAEARTSGPVTVVTPPPVVVATALSSTDAAAVPGESAEAAAARLAAKEKPLEQRQREALDMVLDVVEGLFQDREGSVHGSMVKQTLKRKRPSFSERFHGYRTFNDLLVDAGKRGLLMVHPDERSGGIVISDFGPKA